MLESSGRSDEYYVYNHSRPPCASHLVQGFLAVSTVTSVSAAARDGARAAMLGRSPEQAAHEALPDWVRLESVSDSCGSGHCVQVTARVPIGIPSITSERVTVTRTAYFPEG